MLKKDLVSALFNLVEVIQDMHDAESVKANKLTPDQLVEVQRDLLSRALTALQNSHPKNGAASDQHSYVRQRIRDHLTYLNARRVA